MRLPIILFVVLLGAAGLYYLFGSDEAVTPLKESADTHFTPPPRPSGFRAGQTRPPPAPAWSGGRSFIFPGEPGTRAPVTGDYRFRPRPGEEKGVGRDSPSYAFPSGPRQPPPYTTDTPGPPTTSQYRFRPDDPRRPGKRWTGNYR